MTKLCDLSIVKDHRSGKVRDIYDLGEELLIVTSDRLSAFDVVLSQPIPDKGKVLTQISIFFFEKTRDIIGNHLLAHRVEDYPKEFHPYKEELEYRSMLVKKTRVVPYECIVRGYLAGSAWKEYSQKGSFRGAALPAGMKNSQEFPQPLFTPSTKAEEGHDMNISFEEMKSRMDEWLADKLQDVSLKLYKFAHDFMKERGIIFADTKFEFGTRAGQVFLIDEIFTPDSSRFWNMDDYEVGRSQFSYDKQFVRDYLESTGWDKNPPAPNLPEDIIQRTSEKYIEAFKRITGMTELPWQ